MKTSKLQMKWKCLDNRFKIIMSNVTDQLGLFNKGIKVNKNYKN